MEKAKKKEEMLRLLRFCIVGFSNFVIISLTVWIMMGILHHGYMVANVCAYSIAIASSFVWNKVWVFHSSGGSLAKEILLYLSAFGTAYLLQFCFIFLLIEYAGFNEYVAQFMGLFVFGTVNFTMNKLLTFHSR